MHHAFEVVVVVGLFFDSKQCCRGRSAAGGDTTTSTLVVHYDCTLSAFEGDDADMAKMVAREVGCSRGQAFLASAAEASGCSRPGPPLHTCSGPQRLAKPSAGRVAAVRV